MIREFTPFLCSFDTLLIVLCHQSAKLRSCCRRTVSTRFRGASTLNHTCLATTQDVRRCWTVSSSWSQRGHLSGWGSPLLASLSDVQHLFLIANQRKFLHLAGAQDFHSLRQGLLEWFDQVIIGHPALSCGLAKLEHLNLKWWCKQWTSLNSLSPILM